MAEPPLCDPDQRAAALPPHSYTPRMRCTLLVLLLSFACAREQPAPIAPTDTRASIDVLYVGAPTLDIHSKANDASTTLGKFQNGEAVSVLAKQGDWVEVRFGDGSGWVHAGDLVSPAERKEAEENPRPKFQTPPMPVSAPSAHGEIYLEADVNTDGDVTGARILSNTTGSEALAVGNLNALLRAKFQPIVVKGERKSFKYYHHVSY